MQFSYNNFQSRNWIFIDENLQKKINKQKICFIGCGLGSKIAELAIRTGFSNITIADGDIAELSNLNRQFFNIKDIGKNKAKVTAEKLQQINPNSKIKVFDQFIKEKDIYKVIKDADFIINTVDINSIYYKIVEEGQKEGASILLPFNIGYGGMLIIFNKNTPSLNQLVRIKENQNDSEFLFNLLNKTPAISLPDYLVDNLDKIFKEISKKGYNPQMGIGSNITSSIVISSIIKIIIGQEVKLAPEPIYLDIYNKI